MYGSGQIDFYTQIIFSDIFGRLERGRGCIRWAIRDIRYGYFMPNQFNIIIHNICCPL